MMIVVDNKPMYDHVQGEGVIVKDKRIAIDMLLLRRDLLATNATMRWIDTRQMLSDAMTKVNANVDFLLFVLRFGRFVVVRECQSLEWRSQQRILKASSKSTKRKTWTCLNFGMCEISYPMFMSMWYPTEMIHGWTYLVMSDCRGCGAQLPEKGRIVMLLWSIFGYTEKKRKGWLWNGSKIVLDLNYSLFFASNNLQTTYYLVA